MLFMNPSFNFTFYRTTMSLRPCTPRMCWRTRTARWSAPPYTSTSAPSATTPGTRWAAGTNGSNISNLNSLPISGPHRQTLSLQSWLSQKTNGAGGNLESLQVAYYYLSSHTFLSFLNLRRFIIPDPPSPRPRRRRSFSTAGPGPWWAAPGTTRGWAPPPHPHSSLITPPLPPRPWCLQTPPATSPTPPPPPTAATPALFVNSNKFNSNQSTININNCRLTRILSMRTSLSSYNSQVERHRKSSNIKIISSCILLILF